MDRRVIHIYGASGEENVSILETELILVEICTKTV